MLVLASSQATTNAHKCKTTRRQKTHGIKNSYPLGSLVTGYLLFLWCFGLYSEAGRQSVFLLTACPAMSAYMNFVSVSAIPSETVITYRMFWWSKFSSASAQLKKNVINNELHFLLGIISCSSFFSFLFSRKSAFRDGTSKYSLEIYLLLTISKRWIAIVPVRNGFLECDRENGEWM